MTVFRYDSEMWAVRKTEEHLLDCFQRNYPQILFGTHLPDGISISKLRKKMFYPNLIYVEKVFLYISFH